MHINGGYVEDRLYGGPSWQFSLKKLGWQGDSTGKVLAAKPDHLSSVSGPLWGRERADFY